MDNLSVRQNSARAWFLAARPKTLAGAAVPVIVGMALAVLDNCFKWQPVVLCFLFAFLMQIAANFINDLIDFRKGSDREDRLGPERACAQGWITPSAMIVGILLTLIIACAVGSLLLFYGGWWLVLVGLSCVVFAFLYTLFMSYLGLGDLLVLVFFGLVPVVCTYYVQAGTVTPLSFIVSLACGFAVDALLVVNNFRDREADRRSGKLTVVVRFGETFGRWLYLLTGIIAVLLCIPFLLKGFIFPFVFVLFYLIPHTMVWRQMVKIGSGRALNRILARTSANMLLFALLLLAGCVVERVLMLYIV